jgi:hypothetical protein
MAPRVALTTDAQQLVGKQFKRNRIEPMNVENRTSSCGDLLTLAKTIPQDAFLGRHVDNVRLRIGLLLPLLSAAC